MSQFNEKLRKKIENRWLQKERIVNETDCRTTTTTTTTKQKQRIWPGNEREGNRYEKVKERDGNRWKQMEKSKMTKVKDKKKEK
jgi:hypothetical protein